MKTTRKTAQRRDLTREKIIDATLVVLKSSDPSALTMRRVAEQCGVSAMAIYHHVDDKEQLANLAVDSLFLKAAETPRERESWREMLVDLWCGIRLDLLETPGAGMIFISQAVIGPGTATMTEKMFEMLRAGGLDGQGIAEVADAMTMLAIGSVANELTRPARIREKLGEQVSREDAPVMHAHLTSYASRDGADRFRLALNWLLDGVERRGEKARVS